MPQVSDSRDLASAVYTNPERSCDVVMKGGITSGVVYPHAVCELAQTHRFRNVGGTSAGAIAAAATAAAEYGRQKGGFNELATLPDWLGKGHNLRNLFQPQAGTRRIFAVMLGSLEGGRKGAVLTALRKYPSAAGLGALPALVMVGLVIWGLWQRSPWVLVLLGIVATIIGLAFLLVGIVLAVVWQMGREARSEIPDNGFGLCSGAPGARPEGPALTDWLGERINGYAGLPVDGEPLTFGHLWAGPGKERRKGLADPGEDPGGQLAMMTTNLVNRRAHQLPWDSREWFFDPDEFRQLFPKEVVDWMVDHPPPSPSDYTASKIQESKMRRALMLPLLPLPAAADLPVIVATRMSLSFPVLLSAVPLWNLDMTRPENAVLDDWKSWARRQGDGWDPLEEKDWPQGQPETRPIPERCWFSDGGISSNFPVHFFDSLVPRWPTFAINLRPFPLGQKPDRKNEESNTSMVESNGDGIAEWWYRFPEVEPGKGDGRLVGFLESIVRTMQNRVDEAQMRVPGYRDRVAHVNLDDDEGGMNLTMPPQRIAALTERGRFAAKRLRDAYTPPDEEGKEITWDNHRWVRLRSSLAVLQEMHRHFADGYGKEPENGERTYLELVRRGADEPPGSYRWARAAQREIAEREIDSIMNAVATGGEEGSLEEEAPRPEPVGRIVPRS
jgi:predicted acylesterase/phospholipase RssA